MSPNVPATRELLELAAMEAAIEPHVERIQAAAEGVRRELPGPLASAGGPGGEAPGWVVNGTRHRWLAAVRIAPIACTCIGSLCHITPRTKPGRSTGTTPSSGSRPKTSSPA